MLLSAVSRITQADHKLDDEELCVYVYYECLGVPSVNGDAKFHNPEPYEFEPSDPVKVRFLCESPIAREKLEEKLIGRHAKISPMTDGDTPSVLVESTLTDRVESCFRLAKRWKKCTENILQQFFEEVVVKVHSPLQRDWEEIEERLQQFVEGIDTKNAIVIPDKSKFAIYVVGWKATVEHVYEQLDEMILRTSEEINKNASIIDERVPLKSIDLEILDHCQQLEEIRTEFEGLVDIEVDRENKEIHLKGTPLEVYKSKSKLQETFMSMVVMPVGEFSQHRVDFLRSEPVAQYIGEKFEQGGLDGIIDYGKNGHVVVHANSEEMAFKVAHFLKEAVVEMPRKLSELSDKLLRSEQLAAKIEELEEEYEGLVKIIPVPEDYSILTLVVASENEGEALEKIEEYLSENAIVGESLSVPFAIIRYLYMYQHKIVEIERALEELKPYHVDTQLTDSEICVTGTGYGIRAIQERIMGMIMEIVCQTFTWEKPSILKYLRTSKGEIKVESIEHSRSCIIDLYSQESECFLQEISTAALDPLAKGGQSEVRIFEIIKSDYV